MELQERDQATLEQTQAGRPQRQGRKTATGGGTGMTIGKKLYLNFGAILAMVVVLFLINLIAVQREHSAKAAASQALQMAETTDKIRFQMMLDGKKLMDSMGEEDWKKLDKLYGECVESAHSELFSINPRQSYPPEEWIAADPEFWKPKHAMAPAKPAMEEKKAK